MFIGIKPVPLRLGFTVCGALTLLGSVLGLNLRCDQTLWCDLPTINGDLPTINGDLTTINGDLMVIYPLVNIQKAIENGHL